MVEYRRIRQLMTALAAVSLTASLAGAQAKGNAKAKATGGGSFRVTAPDLTASGRITSQHVYNSFGCTGENISPTLNWTGAPAGTRSFAVTAYDPDAPTGSGWWHWVMYNIPAGTTGLAAGAGNGRNAPRGSVEGMTDFGTKGYGGPCPPVGNKPHHYHFTVYALKVDKLDVPGNATSAMIGFNINANKLASARVTGLFSRK